MGNKCYVPELGGELNPTVIPNPAPGATWLYTVPPLFEVEIRTLHCKCTTSIAVANRVPIFLMQDALGNVQWTLYFTQLLAASYLGNFDLYVGASRTNFSVLLTLGPPAYYNYNDALPSIRMLPGWQLGAFFALLDVADQFSEIRLGLRQWRTN